MKKTNAKLKNKGFKSDRFSKSNFIVFALFFAVFGGYAIYKSFAAVTPATCTQTISTGTNVVTTVSNAAAGAVICLNNGSYGNASFSGITKSSDVIIQSASGTGASISPTVSGSTHLKFQNLVMNGMDISGSTTKNITFAGITFTGGVSVSISGNTNANILIDSSTFANINRAVDDYEARLQIINGGTGLKVSNNVFGPGGCSDGIRLDGGAVEVGPGNEFTGIVQSACSANVHHVDPMQIYGGDNTNIHGNFFHDNSTCIMAPDGSNNETITNNVFDCTGYSALSMGTSRGSIITHNTSNETFRIYEGNSGTNSSNNIVRDNIIGGLDLNSGALSVEDYNVVGGGSGTHDLSCNPTYVGGTTPSTYAGWALAAGSCGKGNASDGKDRGVDFSGSVTPPPPPSGDSTPPTVSMTAPSNGATVSGSSVTVSATASDNVGVVGVQFKLDGNNLGSEDTTSPYSITWNSTTVTNGSHTLTATARDAGGNTTTATNVSITTNNTSACSASSTTWSNNSFAAKTSSFSFDYDSTPNASGIDAVTGLGSGAAAAYSDMAVIVRFNTTGTIDAVNGSSPGANYTAVTAIPYTGGTSYHFKITINPTAHTYSALVTPSGGSALTLATNYPFRSEQATLSSFNNWTNYALSGSHTVCSATIGSSSAKIGDINNDNAVDIFDLSILLSNYNGTTANCDLNTDGTVNIFDLSILLSHYGT